MLDDKGEISDGYHTFNELYDHRNLLYLNLMLCNVDISWYSKRHSDTSHYPGWFIAGIGLEEGTITYHLPDEEKYWDVLDKSNVKELGFAKDWDGHDSIQVMERLHLHSISKINSVDVKQNSIHK